MSLVNCETNEPCDDTAVWTGKQVTKKPTDSPDLEEFQRLVRTMQEAYQPTTELLEASSAANDIIADAMRAALERQAKGKKGRLRRNAVRAQGVKVRPVP